ncbi:MAG TPA: hypothetical protein VLD62_01240 [Acidimicrobiia bacterium]|nr:hypothetical protein [Acidimicrobiia bacterium]
MDDRETVEHVPWAELTSRATPGRRELVILGGAVVGALVLGVVVGRSLVGASSPPEAVTATAPPATTADTTTTTAKPLYSEADLLGYDLGDLERAAVARAEWFVTDFFTADLDVNGAADVEAALADDIHVPDRGGEISGSVAYVEWARAFSIEAVGSSAYRVAVAFRLVGAPPDRGFYRVPVKAVSVDVAVTPEGGTTVLDLPTPVAFPAGPDPSPWRVGEEAEAPSAIVDRAIAIATAWGDEPRLLGTRAVTGGWRIILSVADPFGLRWPFAVTLDDEGRPLT